MEPDDSRPSQGAKTTTPSVGVWPHIPGLLRSTNTNVREWRQYFRDNVYVLKYEDFAKRPEHFLRELFDIFEVNFTMPPSSVLKKSIGPASVKNRTMTSYARKYLQQLYRPYNEGLVEVLGESWRGVWANEA